MIEQVTTRSGAKALITENNLIIKDYYCVWLCICIILCNYLGSILLIYELELVLIQRFFNLNDCD